MIVRCIYSILSSTSAEKQPDHRTLQTKTITIAKFETEEVVARLIEVLDYEDTMMIQESLAYYSFLVRREIKVGYVYAMGIRTETSIDREDTLHFERR